MVEQVTLSGNMFSDEMKEQLLLGLLESGCYITRIAEEIEAQQSDLLSYARSEVACLLDYVTFYLEGKGEYFRDLYVGERLKMSYEPGLSAKDRNNRLIALIERDKTAFFDVVTEASKVSVDAFFDSIIEDFSQPVSSELTVLFIGDCLHQDIMGTLTVLLAKYGISLSVQMVTSKNTVQVRQQLVTIAEQNFDAIFYSPFSYEFSPSLTALMHRKNLFISGFDFAEQLITNVDEVEGNIELLTGYHDCPVFIHNTIVPVRDESKAKLFIKSLLVSRRRNKAAKYINGRLQAIIDRKNSDKFKQLFLVDEFSLLMSESYLGLCQYLYRSPLQHPTKFGVLLAEEYAHRLQLVAKLLDRKLIVCDLDNTLWDGVIGEGAVSHYVSRQSTLSVLKSKGVLLAINSKNDPKNVHWNGGVLDEKDLFIVRLVGSQK